MQKPKTLISKSATPYFENRGRPKKYGFLSKAHNRITELRYLKECMNAIIENAAWHEHNFEEFKKKHSADSNSSLDDRELTIVKKCFDKRNEIAKDMMNDIEEYFKTV